MLDWKHALNEVLQRCGPLPAESATAPESVGRVLAEDVASDVDSPPFDKSLVDGFAVRSGDVQTASADRPIELEVVEVVTAGQRPQRELAPGQAVQIMTGAPLPGGADAVVMIEQAEVHAGRVRLRAAASPEQGLLRRGASMRRDEVVMAAGRRVRALDVGLLTEVGRTEVRTHARPRVSVVSTGDELAGPGQPLGPGQIRNSNGPMLAALATAAGAEMLHQRHSRDDLDELTACIQAGLEGEILVLSGGVSAGVLDLAPQALKACGVEQVFHQVRLKPGKPLWFGQGPAGQLVFGLPGNPVSSLVCFLLFARAAIARLSGETEEWAPSQAALAEDCGPVGQRPTFFPARRGREGRVRLLDWKGSADLRTLADADCLALLEPSPTGWPEGASVDVYAL